MTTLGMMEQDWSHMTETILNLTLEIIYLLTGEDCKVVKNISGEQITPKSHLQKTSSFTTQENSDKKILGIAKKIIKLLTGEVPIRCQDVTVYFSMEEWEYLEGHKYLSTPDLSPSVLDKSSEC
ncbi:gastrula zinc finger protein XlCGF66.1-like [Pyxicephalus adspersus]|uniref:gastrula zinc finger protein XlCGF66.1-like n=1 Tax=Pyxicephalus adspersus TaxID=30357 RepID=UPI003B59E17D